MKYLFVIVLAGLLVGCSEDAPKAPTLPSQVFNICQDKNSTVTTNFSNNNNCHKNNVTAPVEEPAEEAPVIE